MRPILIYICSKIDKENNEISIQQVNNYKYPFENYYQEIEKIKKVKNNEDIEIYGILGSKEEISRIEKQARQNIEEIYHIILKNGVKKAYKHIKGTIKNDIQRFIEYYIEDIVKKDEIKYPLTVKYQIDDIELLCFYNLKNPEENKKKNIDSAIQLFLEKEQPYFSGKQIMLQSFALKNIKGRKILAIMPERNNLGWYALLEGGYKLPIDVQNTYELEKISFRDIQMPTNYDLNSIIEQSCYAYGKYYIPNTTYEEWEEVFLYALATLKIEYTKENLNKIIEEFHKFIEEEICEFILAETFIDKDVFLKETILKIEEIRKYLEGVEDIGISRNTLVQVKNRYAYLPMIYELISKIYPEEVKNRYTTRKFKNEEWKNLIKDLEEGTNYEKGIHLEEIANYFIECIEGLNVSARRKKIENQEIDLCCYNVSENGLLWELGTIVLVECKNYKKPVETKEIRSMIYLMEAKGVNTFILFARNGVTSGAKAEIRKQLIYERNIIVIDEKDLQRIRDNIKPIQILEEKIAEQNDEDYVLL